MYLINKEARLLIIGDPTENFAAEVLPDAAAEVPAASVAKVAKGLEGFAVEWSAEKPAGRAVVELKRKAPAPVAVVVEAPAAAAPKRSRKAPAVEDAPAEELGES